MKSIIVYPDSRLRIKTIEVVAGDKKVEREMVELKKVLEKSENGAGLASTQLGFKGRFFGTKNEGKVEILVNPRIVKVFGGRVYPIVVEGEKKNEFLEGCLSFPNLYGTVKRYLKIEAKWNGGGKILEGFEAVVFQHELDHLDGILFVDHIKRDGGKLYRIIGKEKVEVDINEVISPVKS